MKIVENILLDAPLGEELFVPDGVIGFSDDFVSSHDSYSVLSVPPSLGRVPSGLLLHAEKQREIYFRGSKEQLLKLIMVNFLGLYSVRYDLKAYYQDDSGEFVPLEEIKPSDTDARSFFTEHCVSSIKRIMLPLDFEPSCLFRLGNGYNHHPLDLYYPGSKEDFFAKGILKHLSYNDFPMSLYCMENGSYHLLNTLSFPDASVASDYQMIGFLRRYVGLKELRISKYLLKHDDENDVNLLYYEGTLNDYVFRGEDKIVSMLGQVYGAMRLFVLDNGDYVRVENVSLNNRYSKVQNLLAWLRDINVYLANEVKSFANSLLSNSSYCSLYYDGSEEEFLAIDFHKDEKDHSLFSVYVKNESGNYVALDKLVYPDCKKAFNLPGQYDKLTIHGPVSFKRGFLSTPAATIEILGDQRAIQAYAFEGSMARDLILHEPLDTISDGGLAHNHIQNITLPKTLRHISWGAMPMDVKTVHYEGDVSDYVGIEIRDSASADSFGAADYLSVPTQRDCEHIYFQNEKGEEYEPVDIVLPDSVKDVKAFTLFHFPTLETIVLPSSVTHVGYMAIAKNPKLTRVTFSGNTAFEIGAIKENPNLEALYYDDDLASWANRESDVGLNPRQYAKDFYVRIDGEFVKIEKELTLKGTGTVKPYAFEFFDFVVTLLVLDGVSSIEDYAFFGMKNLKRIVLGKDVKSIAKKAFRGCPNIESIEVDEANPYFYGKGNKVISKAKKEVALQCSNQDDVPEGVLPLIEEIQLGSYPRSHVANELAKQIKKSKEQSPRGFIVFDGKEYAKLNVKPNEYGGSILFYSDGKLLQPEISYFAVEPVRWIVLEETEESYLLLSKEVIDGNLFGNKVYRQSKMRDYLLKTVLPLLFNESEKAVLLPVGQTLYAKTKKRDPYVLDDLIAVPSKEMLMGQYLNKKEALDYSIADFALGKLRDESQDYWTSTYYDGYSILYLAKRQSDGGNKQGIRVLIKVSKKALQSVQKNASYSASYQEDNEPAQKIVYFYNYGMLSRPDRAALEEALNNYDYEGFMKVYKKHEGYLPNTACLFDEHDDIVGDVDITVKENFLKITYADGEAG